MVKLIDRYLANSFLLPLIYCLLAFNVLFIAYDMSDQLKDFMDKQVPSRLILMYYVYCMPICITMTMPFATLLSMLYCLGNMSRNNEIIAMRASGISLFRIIRPYLVLGVLMYAVTLLLSEAFVPPARRLAAEIMPRPTATRAAWAMRGTSQMVVYFNNRESREWKAASMDVSSNLLYDVRVVEYRPNSSDKMRLLEAPRAEFVDDFGWFFYDAKISRYVADETTVLLQKRRKYTNPRYSETPTDITSAQHSEVEMMTYFELASAMRRIIRNSDKYRALRMERSQRIALPSMCIVFILLAAPFGIFHTRAGMVKGVVTSISLCLACYLVTAMCIGFGRQGYVIPVLAAWAPIILFVSLGFYLLRRMR